MEEKDKEKIPVEYESESSSGEMVIIHRSCRGPIKITIPEDYDPSSDQNAGRNNERNWTIGFD